MDIAEKAEAVRSLVTVYEKIGDEAQIDCALRALRGTGATAVEEPERRNTRGKRGPYKMGGIYKGLSEGVASLVNLVPRVEKFQYVPGKSEEDKCKWLELQLNKSKSTYRKYPDGAWGLRHAAKNGNGDTEDEE